MTIRALLGLKKGLYRNRFTASTDTHLRIQTFPAIIEFANQTPVCIHNAKSSDVNGAKFDYLTFPAIVHDLSKKRRNAIERELDRMWQQQHLPDHSADSDRCDGPNVNLAHVVSVFAWPFPWDSRGQCASW